MFPISPGLADVAVMVLLCAAAAAVVADCRRSGSGCRDGAVGVLCVASSLIAAARLMLVCGGFTAAPRIKLR